MPTKSTRNLGPKGSCDTPPPDAQRERVPVHPPKPPRIIDVGYHTVDLADVYAVSPITVAKPDSVFTVLLRPAGSEIRVIYRDANHHQAALASRAAIVDAWKRYHAA